MPIREYQCQNDACEGERAEVKSLSFKNVEMHPDAPFCPKCGNRMVWAPTVTAGFILKGPGWTPKGNQ